MKLTREQVLHIAELAKLEISEEETELFAEQLSEILDYVEMLNRLDTTDISPMAHAINMHNVTSPDRPQPSLAQDRALANAPKRQNGYFRVKPILE